MRGATDRDEERRRYAASSPLTNLVRALGRDVERWLPVALEPLPETFRLTQHRLDRKWTADQVKALGAVALPWMGAEQAFVMPFARGRAPEGDAQRLMAILHETGRITRQEAASMLPVPLLNPEQHHLALDMCAAPGSKATQLAEVLHPGGVVIANEPVSGRLNMLVSNRSRLGLANMVIAQHDGRHFARVPPPGLDLVVADVPCTGTATTRKNRDVWWDWTPKEGRKMFNTQVEIAERGANLLAPGGQLVISTCSLDPLENEAVVAEVLRRCPHLTLMPIDAERFPGLTLHDGLSDWPLLDESGLPVDPAMWAELPFYKEAHASPTARIARGVADDAPLERTIANALPHCKRLWHDDHDTGGFFLALLTHDPAHGLTKAPTFHSRRERQREPNEPLHLRPTPRVTSNSVVEADPQTVEHIETLYGWSLDGQSVWMRGKRLNVAPPAVKARLFDPPCPTNKGDAWPGGTFHPVQTVHVGLPAFTLKKDSWRSRQESLYLFGDRMTANISHVSEPVFRDLLRGWAPLVEEFASATDEGNLQPGARLIRCTVGGRPETISVWVGARVTLMIDRNEQDVLRRKLGLPWRSEEEAA